MNNFVKTMVFIVISAFLFSSCEKEGQYLPKRKITRIESSYYIGENSTAFHNGAQSFEWEGDLLRAMRWDDNVNWAEFEYDSQKRISKIYTHSDYPIVFQFIYEKKKLIKIEAETPEGEQLEEYTFKRSGNKIVEITITNVSSKANVGKVFNPLQFVLPIDVANCIIESKSKNPFEIFRITWDGKNITECEQTGADNVTVMKNYWKYDNKTNPFKGLPMDELQELYSANNVVESRIVYPDNTEQVYEYSYEYDGEFPVKRTWADLFYSTRTYTVTYFYE